MRVQLVDGTYELFRHFYALPSRRNARGEEVAAAAGVASSVLSILEAGGSHVAVATDQVIESFRNRLWQGYKTGAGIEPDLWSQFPLVEEALAALGVVVWAMVEYEADDALAAGAAVAAADSRVERVEICTPDKDLAQCVVGERVVQVDRRRDTVTDEAGVVAKFGVPPASIPDYLALVGDSADGFPGLPGWGAVSSAKVLARYLHIQAIPALAREWDVEVRGAPSLAAALDEHRELALLFRRLATLVVDGPIGDTRVDDLAWSGPTAELAAVAMRLEMPQLVERAERAASQRSTVP